jgi:hypothetical protein
MRVPVSYYSSAAVIEHLAGQQSITLVAIRRTEAKEGKK